MCIRDRSTGERTMETRGSKKRRATSCEPADLDTSDDELLEEARSPPKQPLISRFLTSPLRESAAIKPSTKPKPAKPGRKGQKRNSKKAKTAVPAFDDEWGDDALAEIDALESPCLLITTPVVIGGIFPELRPQEDSDAMQASSAERATSLVVQIEGSAPAHHGRTPMCGHDEHCVRRTVRKNTPNFGREFYTCARVVPCGTFYWVDKLVFPSRSPNRASLPFSDINPEWSATSLAQIDAVIEHASPASPV
eukprot:TRINITY_DN29112_c0_g1_i1.p1 TRINITY_DN29112_c0_g1~~TRINITY_DN29112_c0_g1_i1.p1  ORF type:complete len:251 (-),score=8.68 TRINITY_DN29112_c0_g1_i1:47-799(-)